MGLAQELMRRMYEDLIARLEAATEGSSELDWGVYLTATERGRAAFARPEDSLTLPWPQWIEHHPIELRLPHCYDGDMRPYTRSIDAALTLLPKDAGISIDWRHKLMSEPGAPPLARVMIDGEMAVWAPTIPLALCVAALKAGAT